MAYNWQQADWPHFSYDASKFEQAASVFIQKSAYAQGVLDGTETAGQEQSILNMLAREEAPGIRRIWMPEAGGQFLQMLSCGIF